MNLTDEISCYTSISSRNSFCLIHSFQSNGLIRWFRNYSQSQLPLSIMEAIEWIFLQNSNFIANIMFDFISGITAQEHGISELFFFFWIANYLHYSIFQLWHKTLLGEDMLRKQFIQKKLFFYSSHRITSLRSFWT